mmetsp:Transcript_40610/g.63427  ORF Transcript_40610/g.63427 Transcript_40610/m.63427 type:complete len:217 (+) Transcript_40610:215-865(+)
MGWGRAFRALEELNLCFIRSVLVYAAIRRALSFFHRLVDCSLISTYVSVIRAIKRLNNMINVQVRKKRDTVNANGETLRRSRRSKLPKDMFSRVSMLRSWFSQLEKSKLVSSSVLVSRRASSVRVEFESPEGSILLKINMRQVPKPAKNITNSMTKTTTFITIPWIDLTSGPMLLANPNTFNSRIQMKMAASPRKSADIDLFGTNPGPSLMASVIR